MALLLLLLPASAFPASHSDVTVEIDAPGLESREGALWLGYLMARAAYIDEHKSDYDWKPGVIMPSFQEELAARTAAARIYRELKEKDPQLNVVYFEELLQVADNAFLGEYVWTYLHQAGWSLPRDPLRLLDFMHWRAQHVAQHRVLTQGGLRFARKGGGEAPQRQAVSEMQTLLQGQKLLQKGEVELAIATYVDPVLEHFSRDFRDSDKIIYSAGNMMQMVVYGALRNDEKKSIVVLDSTWGSAYLMKAYGLTELKRLEEARAMLEKAVALSPLSAPYLSELAFTYQAQGDCDRSIAIYKRAEDAVELGSDEETRKVDLGRALRGQGYCLTEQGRFDEAEALYQRCLKLDPSDAKARNELAYIREQRGH